MSHFKCTSYDSGIYFLPCRPESVYVNITDSCLNECLFCIKRNGPLFYGSDLSLDGVVPSYSKTVASLKSSPNWSNKEEVVFCGMGEPLLRYEHVLDICRWIRTTRSGEVSIRIDTSGLHWNNEKRLDILDVIDVLSISLNAENASKYDELCRSIIDRPYEVLMSFLQSVKAREIEKKKQNLHFPEVRLSVVDTSEEEFIPNSGKKEYAPGTFPVPDFTACHEIAKDHGWALVIKRLFRDSCDDLWNDPAIQEMCARGIQHERCRDCTYRH